MQENINQISEETKAKEALEKADLNELYSLYDKKKKECALVVDAMSVLSKHRDGVSPRIEEYKTSIEAMEKVSLAAIDLAKFYIGKNQK